MIAYIEIIKGETIIRIHDDDNNLVDAIVVKKVIIGKNESLKKPL